MVTEKSQSEIEREKERGWRAHARARDRERARSLSEILVFRGVSLTGVFRGPRFPRNAIAVNLTFHVARRAVNIDLISRDSWRWRRAHTLAVNKARDIVSRRSYRNGRGGNGGRAGGKEGGSSVLQSPSVIAFTTLRRGPEMELSRRTESIR